MNPAPPRRQRVMTTYVLIPGAGGMASYWSRVVPLLEQAGHEAIAVDLPGPTRRRDCRSTPTSWCRPRATSTRSSLVAQSLGGFTAPMAAEALPVKELILVNAMIPVPGETPGPVVGRDRRRRSA